MRFLPITVIRPEFFPLYSGVPFQAVCATLHNVHPANVDKKNKEYITEAHVYLQDIISKAAPNSMRVRTDYARVVKKMTSRHTFTTSTPRWTRPRCPWSTTTNSMRRSTSTPYCGKSLTVEHGEKLYEIAEKGQGKVVHISLYLKLQHFTTSTTEHIVHIY